jgi:hypothetical protein
MKWEHFPDLRRRPPTPSKGRGPVQVRVRRAFIASGAEVLSLKRDLRMDASAAALRAPQDTAGRKSTGARFKRSGRCVIRSSVCRRMARGCGDCATAGMLKLPLCFPALVGNEVCEQYQCSVRIVSL